MTLCRSFALFFVFLLGSTFAFAQDPKIAKALERMDREFTPESFLDAVDYVEANEKVYRMATTYEIPEEVGQM